MQLQRPDLLQQDLLIDNEWRPKNERFSVTNPATGAILARVSDATATDATQAVIAAHRALAGWSSATAKERSQVLKRWYQLVRQHSGDLVLLLTSEQGKPLAEAKGELEYGASFIEWNAEECRRVYGEVIPSPVSTKRMLTIKQPVGVVAAITPWNFPVAMITRKIAPAIAAGCTVVLKPAEDTPLCALALAQLALEAGLPAGVLNVLPTSHAAEVGAILTSDPLVRKISFTGSTAVGKLLMQQAATTVKRVSLELGGNAPVIVFEDADIPLAVKGTLASKYRNAGQTCVCANRIYVHRRIHDEFVAEYRAAVAELKVGDGALPGVQIGPLINTAAVEKVTSLLNDATNKGAQLVMGGSIHPQGPLFFEPTILTHCNNSMQLSSEEIFGPVSGIYVFDTEDEVVQLANDTAYGLAAYFFSRDIGRVWRVAEQLQYGMIGVNEGIISHAEAPFGGLKESGFGKEGSHYGIEEYLDTKYICLGGLG